MRERLIELLLNCYDSTDLQYYDLTDLTDKFMGGAEDLADYLLENNVVVLPCKVGDVVYTTYDGSLSEYKVMDLIRNDFWWAVLYNPYCAPEHQNEKSCLDFSLGRFVFLTREEAEKALKERGND